MTTKQHHPTKREAKLERIQQEQLRQQRRQRTHRIWSALITMAVIGLMVFGLWQARPETAEAQGPKPAPSFTLPTTAGTTVSLADYRGKPVILYFNEGAGCGSCTQQMAAIEQEAGFADAGIIVLPIVMNTAEQIQPDMERFGVTTPYLLDDGTVSKAYNTLDKGMHKGLPGHGFVLIDQDGNQRWQGNYPSMWLDPKSLLKEAASRL